jgi:TetR/AcrR family transcriptional regulator
MTETEKLTEEKIFEAATDVFVRKGMDGARMQDIASKAGINKALLHYYYRSKEKLFTTVFEMIARRLFKKFSPILDDTLTLKDKITFFFKEHITFLQENPALPGFVLNEVNRNPERIRKLLSGIDFETLYLKLYAQHRHEFEKYNITKRTLPQFLVSMAAISVFPFAAKGILEGVLETQNIGFNEFIEERKSFAADFVINAMIGGELENTAGKTDN